MVSDMVKADHHLFNEQDLDLESLIEIELIRKRKHVARPIPTQTQPWDDNIPALIPFYERNDPDVSRGVGGIIIVSTWHA